MVRRPHLAVRLFIAFTISFFFYSEGFASVATESQAASSPLKNVEPNSENIHKEGEAVFVEGVETPLEEIEEEEVLPEDFFDFETLDAGGLAALPPLPIPVDPTNPLSPVITYDVPIVLNALVTNYITFFQTRLRDRFEEWLARSRRYIPLMQQILKEHQLPEDLVFLALIESGFNPKAFSRAKAAGPWQFIQGTGKKYGLRIDSWIDERRDPVKSTVAAAKYLKDLYGLFGSWPLSMASYNAGEGRVKRAMARTKAEDFWELNSSSLRPETKNYVPKFMAATIIAKDPEKYGFFIDYQSPLIYDEVEVSKPVHFKVLAKAAGISVSDLKIYNPELKKEMTPPKYPRYRLKLPPGTKERFLANFSPKTVKEIIASVSQKHRIQRGETVSSIARKYDVSVKKILEANQLERESTIQAGQILLIPEGN
jgi:membrane-bound lytic murein transglycosylase D